MTVVKICGIKDVANGVRAIDGGARYLGFIFYPPSHRSLRPEEAARLIAELRAARPGGWEAVGVFVNEPLDLIASVVATCALDVVQLNGDETAEYIAEISRPVFKAVRVAPGAEAAVPTAAAFGAARVLLDANVPGQWGGTGQTVAWTMLGRAVADGFLAGGLTPENVAEAILATRPWGVDVSSGVERDREKDPELITRFLTAVREADVQAAAMLVPSAGDGGVR